MINLVTEELLTLAAAVKLALWPARRKGRKLHVSCLHRYATHGLWGIILETVQVGGTRCTSREAIIRFLEALTEARNRNGEPRQGGRSATQRKRASEQAEAKLRDMGA